MKNFFTLLSFLFFIVALCFGQQAEFEKSLATAEKKSLNSKKPLFIYIGITPPPQVKNYNDGFSNPEVVNLLNSNFISYKVNRTDTANASPLIRKYCLSRFPTFIFLDSKGGLIKQVSGLETMSSRLKNTLTEALALSKEKSLVDYESDFEKGNYSEAEIKNYITKRINAGIRNNADVIEKYVDFLKVSDLDKYETVLFILNAGPYVDGKAYRVAFINKPVVDSIYKKEPFEVRSAINNAIINNSLSSAIKNKNTNRAMATANFTRSTWGSNYKEGYKNYTNKMIQYYYGVKDTANYLKQASMFYDQYFMNISADSVKKLEQKKIDGLTQKLNAERNASGIPKTGLKSDTVRVTYSEQTSTIATDLNNAAYNFYLTGTKNQTYLIKAMNWSKRSIELNEVYAFYDTLAHIYYQLGFYLEAENTQKKALELAIKSNQDVKHLSEELKKIQNKTL